MLASTRLRLCFVLMAVSLLLAGPAIALDLDTAKRQGLVGEQLNGYVGVVNEAPGVQALVNSVNMQRRQLYQDVARKNGVPLSGVERLAGDKAINQSASGTMVQDANGAWVTK